MSDDYDDTYGEGPQEPRREVETREIDMNASQHPMEPRVALVSVYTAADNTAVIPRRVDEAVRLSTYLDAISEVSNPVIRRAAAELCMAVADAEHAALYRELVDSEAAWQADLADRDSTIERVRALCDSWGYTSEAEQIRAALEGKP